MVPILATVVLILLSILAISLFTYRGLFHPTFKDTEYTKRSGLEKGEFDDAFLSLPWQRLSLESRFGYRVEGSYLAGASPRAPTALFVHGITWTRFGMYKYMRPFARRGWNVAAIDLAGHGETKAPRKYGPSFGYYEKFDIASTVGELGRLFPESSMLGLVGESLGAASALQYAGLGVSRQDEPVRFVIADCPFTSIAEEMDARLDMMGLPRFLRRSVIRCVSLFSKAARGFSLEDASPLQAAVSSDMPIFLIHGMDDRYVPFSMSVKIYNERIKAGKAATGLLLVPGARHAKSLMTDPGSWEAKVFDFIGEHANP